MDRETLGFLKSFFEKDVRFFAKNISIYENDFMLGFNDAHTAWGGIKASPEIFALNEALFQKLDKLFDVAFSFYCQILAYRGTYNQAILQDTFKTRWSEIQQLASIVLKERPNYPI